MTGSAEETPATLASRLGEARVNLRPELEVSRHSFRGEPAYVIGDPLSFQTTRFSVEDYRILTRLNEEQALGEIFVGLVADEILAEDDEDRFFRFVISLHHQNLLQLPVSDDKALYKRYQAKEAGDRTKLLMSAFFCQIPVVNPNAFLDRTMRFVRPLFTRPAFVAWLLLVATGGLLVFRNWQEFLAPMSDTISSGNLPLLWVILIGLKIIHEFGHAYACKLFGGHVPEMGVYLIALTPCAYVDTTSAWGFTRKRDRLIVCFGGMYVELAMAALAMILWSVTSSPLLASVAHNTVLLASVVTVGFNINPLMRYDGYYAFSDLVEIPNLRARATAAGTQMLKRVFLRLRTSTGSESFQLRAFLTVFGVCSGVYKMFVIFAISMLFATKFFLVGMALAGTYVFLEAFRIISRTVKYLWYDGETAPIRKRAVAASVVLIIAPTAIFYTVDLPSRVVAPAIVGSEDQSVVRAEVEGFLSAVHASVPRRIAEGDLLVELEEPGAAELAHEAAADLELSSIRLRRYQVEDPALARQQAGRVEREARTLADREHELGLLSIFAPSDGRVVACLDSRSQGLWIERGAPVATICSGRPVARAYLTAEDVAKVRPAVGQAVEFRPAAEPGATATGTITRVAAGGQKTLQHAALTHAGGGEIPVNPLGEAQQPYFEVTILLDDSEGMEWWHGMTGKVRLEGEAETLHRLFIRKFLRFADRLRNG